MLETLSQQALARGGKPCRGNCPVHMSCAGHIAALGGGGERFGRINGLVPAAQCDRCEALFGLDRGVLRFLEHTQEFKQRQSPPGIL
jgi:hypothetical protein